MATSIIDGPQHVYGSMAGEASPPQTYPIIDPDTDAGPSMFYQGTSVPDPRFIYQKDRVVELEQPLCHRSSLRRG